MRLHIQIQLHRDRERIIQNGMLQSTLNEDWHNTKNTYETNGNVWREMISTSDMQTTASSFVRAAVLLCATKQKYFPAYRYTTNRSHSFGKSVDSHK